MQVMCKDFNELTRIYNHWSYLTNMIEKIEEYLAEANEITDEVIVERWVIKVFEFLRHSIGEKESSEFFEAGREQEKFYGLAQKIGYLDSMIVNKSEEQRVAPFVSNRSEMGLNSKVFVVHGHDGEAKEIACRFIEKLGLEPVVLHEQANEGQTIVEKFEKHSDVAFALILLTPDDKGESVNALENLRFRARQNVVLELGYFMGALGRKNVCALHKGGIEMPSDYTGVLYVSMDEAGAWKNKVAQELIECQLKIDLSGLL